MKKNLTLTSIQKKVITKLTLKFFLDFIKDIAYGGTIGFGLSYILLGLKVPVEHIKSIFTLLFMLIAFSPLRDIIDNIIKNKPFIENSITFPLKYTLTKLPHLITLLSVLQSTLKVPITEEITFNMMSLSIIIYGIYKILLYILDRIFINMLPNKETGENDIILVSEATVHYPFRHTEKTYAVMLWGVKLLTYTIHSANEVSNYQKAKQIKNDDKLNTNQCQFVTS